MVIFTDAGRQKYVRVSEIPRLAFPLKKTPISRAADDRREQLDRNVKLSRIQQQRRMEEQARNVAGK